ncbi:Zn(2)-C6 fungal-type DNA-binding domain protein [Metarhizium album ARSEF 1941]|uniref:Zn(2)-C6 fungal-type DNA-binding domain protein n=1 Tax=Metarhizium album (strain ARSEF 1941) TaxID=1081103 RepID=A0A0B2WMY7_METAS|nr:Zn(2)-C6 fungal-type DNA-binding domain protein [Metarhizium album ARSEF 1941]KHN95268.1 Zn(2)-C6 fungal-type DNA-binding domain protein [Metarhizium album ARSEF 1941]
MPNTGRPSRGCHLCRQRRVKCDLGRPGCQRCTKYGAECPGYRDQHELVFRHANPSTAKKRMRRKDKDADGSQRSSSAGTRSGTPASILSSSGGGTVVFDPKAELLSLSADAVSETPATISRPLTEHWTSHSVPMLLNVYSTLDFLHNIYRINPRDGPLVWAAHLFTRTYVTNIRHPVSIFKESEVENQRELGTYLGRTLSAVNRTLEDPDAAFRDDVLATVWILANYELLVGSLGRMELLSPWHLHTRGLYSILKARGSQHLLTAQGRTAFWPCYNMVVGRPHFYGSGSASHKSQQVQALVSNTECPPESDEWLDIIRNNPHKGEGLTLHVSAFIIACTRVQAAISDLLRRRDFVAADEQYESLVAQLTEAEEQVNNYVETAADATDDMDSYMRNMYNSGTIKGWSYVLMLANFLTHYPPSRMMLRQLWARRRHCLEMIRAAGQSIVDSVPFALGPLAAGKDSSPKLLFDALKMVWPLTAVYVVGTTLPEQKSEAEKALVFIGNEFGVRQALNTYPGALLFPLEARQPLGLATEADVAPPLTNG